VDETSVYDGRPSQKRVGQLTLRIKI